MYFASGWPKAFEINSNTSVIDIKHSHDAQLIGVLTNSDLIIWSGDQHRIVLATYSRNSLSLDAEGNNKALCWNSTSKSIAVLTTKGLLQFYEIEEATNSQSEQSNFNATDFRFDTEYHFIRLGEKIKLNIIFKTTIKVSQGGITCLCDGLNDSELILCTQEGFLIRLTWFAKWIQHYQITSFFTTESVTSNSGSTASNLLPPTSAPSRQPIFITRSKSKWDHYGMLFGIVFSDGEAAVLTPLVVPTVPAENEPAIYFSGTILVSSENNNSSLNTHININGKLQKDSIRKLTAVQMALNMKHNLVAIGCASGDTVLYDLSHKRIGRVLSLLPWGITSDITGNVSCMQWTPDETALCVAWEKRGLAVWSIYGCRLFCTIPQLESSVHRPTHSGSEPLKDGVTSISWGSEGYYLFIGVRDAPEVSPFLIQFSFIKSISTNMTNWQNGCEKILLQGEEQLLILTYKGKQLGDISWKCINIPHVYLADNWPIRYVSVSRDGNQIGAAGKNGLALYNMLSKRWKLFGDRNQEAQIRCCGLSWFKQAVIIIANAVISGHSIRYQILLYPKGHLDASSLLYKCNIPQQPLFMDCNDKFLIIFTTNNVVLQYRIHATFSPTTSEIEAIELQLVRQLSMTFLSTNEVKSFAAGFNSVPLSFTLLPTFAPNSSNEISQCLILASSGDLLLVNVEQSTQVLLAKHVEQYWIANSYSTSETDPNPDGTDQDFRNTLWSYGESGLQVWFPFLSKGQTLYPTQHPSSSDIQIAVESTKLTTLSRDKSLEFDLEVYPIGFVSELGVIVGLTQELEFTCNSKTPHFNIQIKTHPFLHSILRRLLERVSTKSTSDGYSAAYKVAQKFSFIPHFDHSLELLLHETLEDEKIDNVNFVTSPLLQKVVAFIKKFSQFPDVVASCARKTDPAIWKQLFSLAGSPKILFEQCLARKKVLTAASYLRILQYIEGKADARLCALKLLDEALNIDDLELAGDLRRFLLPDEEIIAESRNSIAHISFHEGSGELSEMLSPDDQEYYLQELLLARYARKLLHQQQLKKLIIFGKKVSHDLRPWLVRERRRAAALEETGLETALTVVHLQFHVPYPESFHNSATAPSLSLSQVNDEQAEQGLQYLLQEMLATQCVEWSLVLATVVLNGATVVQILRDSFHLWKEYHSMLTNQRCKGYQDMLKFLKDELKSDMLAHNSSRG